MRARYATRAQPRHAMQRPAILAVVQNVLRQQSGTRIDIRRDIVERLLFFAYWNRPDAPPPPARKGTP